MSAASTEEDKDHRLQFWHIIGKLVKNKFLLMERRGVKGDEEGKGVHFDIIVASLFLLQANSNTF